MASSPDPYRRLVASPRRSAGLPAGAVLVAVALAAAFGIGVLAMAVLWRADPRVVDAVAAATGRVELPTAPSALAPGGDERSWTDEDMAACRGQAKAAADTAAARRLAAVSADRVGLGAPDAVVVEDASFLLCGITHKRLHLCEPYWNTWLIDAVRAHAKEFREVTNSAYWAKVSIAENARRRTDGGAVFASATNDLDQTTRDVAGLHHEIGDAVRGLVRDGILDREAFGVFLGFGIPTDVGVILGDAQADRSLCG